MTEKKLSEHDVATAFASSVLPVPGGPYSRMPVREERREIRQRTFWCGLRRPTTGGARRTAPLLEPVPEQLWPFERELDRVEDVALDTRQPSDVVPRHVGDLWRADALAVRRARLVKRSIEVERGERHACVREVGERRCGDRVAGGGRGSRECEHPLGRGGAGAPDEVDEVISDERGSLHGKCAE